MSKNESQTYSYDDLFYAYLRESSGRSARAVLPRVIGTLGVKSVLDVGCGAGAWLSEYEKLGVTDICGLDGDYVNRSMLLIDAGKFVPQNVASPFDVGRSFDLVQCLEVAEHVPMAASATLVESIVRHGKRVLFSAAVPGQGGENHVNEQPYEFWRALFRERGYRLFDFVRPRIQDIGDIEPWYRYNTLFFAHDSIVDTLPAEVTRDAVPDDAAIADFSPLSYRIRKSIMRLLPASALSGLAVLKHKLVTRQLQRR